MEEKQFAVKFDKSKAGKYCILLCEPLAHTHNIHAHRLSVLFSRDKAGEDQG